MRSLVTVLISAYVDVETMTKHDIAVKVECADPLPEPVVVAAAVGMCRSASAELQG